MTRVPSSPYPADWRPRLLAALLVLVAATGLRAQADVIRPKRGGPTVAKVWEQGQDEVVYNVYRTAVRRVTHGTEKIDARQVKQVIPDPDPHRSFWRRAQELASGSAEDWYRLGLEARKEKLRGLAKTAFLEALVRDAGHEEARKELGSRAKDLIASDPRLNPELKKALDDYLRLDDFGARERAAKELEKLGCAFPFPYLERAWRSSKQPSGRTDDRLLTLDSKEHPGGVYTLFVPKAYDPFRPTPLVVGLHGGGPDGKDNTGVVGSGREAMSFFQDGAEQRGWLVVCPTALRAPWSERENDGFLLAVVEEVCCLFNVDRNRIYLAGHSMGGYGTWHFGPRYAHLWAAISPNSGGGRPDIGRLEDTLTGVYCYHGADDPVVGAANDREIADQMLRRNMDFVYCEIPDSGHGWPRNAREEMWEFFDARRLAVTPRRTDRGRFAISEEPLSSFLDKPDRAEIEAFGPLAAPPPEGDAANRVKELLEDLLAGGGRARKAAQMLSSVQDPKVAASVAKVLANVRLASDARRFAAEALGSMGQDNVLKTLRRAMADEELEVCAAAAVADGRLQDPEAAKAFHQAVQSLARGFEKKKTGDRMDYTDFEAFLEAAATFAEGIGASKDPGCAAALHEIAEQLLLPALEVPASTRAGQDPARPRRRLAGALADACAALASPEVRPTLEALAAREDLGAAARARELLTTLGGSH